MNRNNTSQGKTTNRRRTYRRKPQLLLGTETRENAFLIPEQASSQREKITSNKTSKALYRAVGKTIYNKHALLMINMRVSLSVQHILPLIRTRTQERARVSPVLRSIKQIRINYSDMILHSAC